MSENSAHTDLLAEVENVVGSSGLRTDPADCWAYGYDNSRRQAEPLAVVVPSSHSQICKVIRLANRYDVPVVPRGLGSGTTGAAVPVHRGLVISTEQMTRIRKIDTANRVAVVETGATNADLQEAAAAQGFFWPPDPTSAEYCTVGGNLACNAAGPRAVKYGTARENTLGLRAISGDGRSLRTGCYTTKGVVGYDLTRLLIGSEGTLALISEATLKLTPSPEAKHTLRATYSSVKHAAVAVSRIMAQPQTPSALEFMDGSAIKMSQDFANTDLPSDAGALLLIEVDGPKTHLDAGVAAIRKAASIPGLIEFRAATTQDETDLLWASRKALSPALRKIAPKKINEDVVVPVSRLAEFIEGIERLSETFEIPIVNFGHAGNGNIHVNLLTDPDDPTHADRARRCLSEVFTTVLALGGTLSGEHGIGYDKKKFVELEIEPETLALMKLIKRQFDPNGILNPGKMFED